LGKLYQEQGNVTLVNDTTKDLYLTVPDGKKWLVHAIPLHNGDDVTRVLAAFIVDGSNNTLHELESGSAASGARLELLRIFSASPDKSTACSLPIKSGNKLKLRWAAGGASSGGTAYYCVTYEEMVE